MKALIFTILLFLFNFCLKSQPLNKIHIIFKDTINNQKDCALRVILSRTDKKAFLFPKKYSIGEITDDVDLTYNIEKLVDGKYVSYRCNQSPISMPCLHNKKIEYKKFKPLQLIDSLQGFECLERGQYRIQIQYYNRGDYGRENFNPLAESNWVEFYVAPEKIHLGYSRLLQRKTVN